jgi:methylenetetrahydrofolate dehydrogenase (NADP+)/methenyltetrahydrofolate cyclohydrolase
MAAQIIDGKKMAEDLRQKLADSISNLDKKPYLAVILVGNDEASIIYDQNKQKAAVSMGMECHIYHLQENAGEEELLELISKLNQDKRVNGILVQMPLPKHLDSSKIIESIAHEKDVDGFGPYNAGLLQSDDSRAIVAATPKGILYMLNKTVGDLTGKHAVIIGRSKIVGKPLASLLLNNNCTVTVTHSKSVNIKEITKTADILVAACGCPKMVKKDWVKEGVAVIDVGINRVDGKLCGDIDFDEVKKTASFITPVPGGVGPMTIAMLLDNTYQAYINQNK